MIRLSWGCWCDAFYWECCNIPHAPSAGWNPLDIWRLFPTLWNDLIRESLKWCEEPVSRCSAWQNSVSVASVSLQPAAARLSRRVVCRNSAWPSAETAATQPAPSWEKGRESEGGNFFFFFFPPPQVVQFCNDTTSPLNWICGGVSTNGI